MPLLRRFGIDASEPVEKILRRTLEREAPGARTVEPEPKRGRWLETCANSACRTGWMQVWRNRAAPIFEGAWTCSEACMRALISQAVVRERKGHAETRPPHRHRLPLGLLMLEQGWITAEQLRGALESQRKHGTGRLGSWLVKQHGVKEELVTRALAMQWSCPVLSAPAQNTAQLSMLIPRLFVDAFGVAPLRVAAGKVLYLGFEDRLDPVLARAIERMTGVRAESGVMTDSQFSQVHARMLRGQYPAVELVEASSEETLARVLARSVERARPVETRLIRMHEFLWMRMIRNSPRSPAHKSAGGLAQSSLMQSSAVQSIEDVQDVICTIAGQ